MDLELFEWQLRFVKEHFEVLDADGLAEVLSVRKLKRASVVITFDDGFSDNYVYAYPILKRLRLNAIVFLPTSKIKEGKERFSLFDYWEGRISYSDLSKPSPYEDGLYRSLRGDFSEFLVWDEIEDMVKSGVFCAGSHGHLHVKYFASDRVVGISGYRKPHWSFVAATGGQDREGLPVFPVKSSLACRRFFPDRNLMELAVSLYKSGAGEDEIIDRLGKFENRGRFESEIEAQNRIKEELLVSKGMIEERMAKRVEMLSWPWGEYFDIGVESARESGFRFCFSTKKSAVIGDMCTIGRIKAPKSRKAFVRKLTINSTAIGAMLYKAWHK